MLKVASILLVGLLFHCPSFAQDVPNRKEEGFVGPVRSVRIEGFDCSPSPGVYQEKLSRIQVVSYDRRGNTIERTLYKADGSIEHLANYTTDEKGRASGWREYYGKGIVTPEGLHKHAVYKYRFGKLVEIIVYREESLAHKATFAYDGRGNKVEELNSGPDASVTRRSYRYDASNHLVGESVLSPSSNQKTERDFDAAGNVIQERFFENGVLISTTFRSFEDGKLVKVAVLKPDRSIISSTLNKYNPSRDLILSIVESDILRNETMIEYDRIGRMRTKETATIYKDRRVHGSHDPDPGRVLIRYNEKGLEVESLYYNEAGALCRKQTMNYDERGNLIDTVSYRADGQIEDRQVYEYDSYGNRIKTSSVTATATGELRSSVAERRIINYY